MDMVARFFKQSLLSYKSLFGFLDPKVYFFVKIINPVFQLIFFSLLASFVYQTKDVTPWVIGNAFLLSMYNSMFGVGTVMVNERQFGTLASIIASPSNNFLIFVGRAFMHILDSALTVAILTISILVGTVYLLAGYFLLKILERKARNGATMDLY